VTALPTRTLADCPGAQPLTMSEWDASRGGRVCVLCGRYRRADDLYLRGEPNCGHVHGPGLHVAVTTQPVCGACLDKAAETGGNP